jgi:hypothetical protein
LTRDSQSLRHLVSEPPIARADAVRLLWGDDRGVPLEQFHPDPLDKPIEGPQKRFYFHVSQESFEAIKDDLFKRVYFRRGWGLYLEHWLHEISWFTDDVREVLTEAELRGELAAHRLELDIATIAGIDVHLGKTFTARGEPPYGDIVVWVGRGDFADQYEMQAFQYAPEDPSFYAGVSGDPRLVREGWVGRNADLKHFVEQRRVRPSDARDLMARINTELFRMLIAALGEVFAGAGPLGADSALTQAGSEITEIVRENRAIRAMAIAQRRVLPKTLLYRGTTLRWKRGGSEEVHDLHFGTYFTPSEAVARVYRDMRGTPDDPAILLEVEIAREELGRVLDLVDGPHAQRWDELIAEAGGTAGMVNERYRSLFFGFLDELGLKIGDFDTIIARDYIRDSVQIIVRNPDILDVILGRAREIHQ